MSLCARPRSRPDADIEEQKRVARPHDLQSRLEQNLNRIADDMAASIARGVTLSPERWEQLWRAWDSANAKVQEVGEAIRQAARDLGVIRADQ
jgi:hypothetical protein